jgi:hypothetical protein
MDRKLTQKFYERWPEWFRGRHEPVTQNLMAFGFEHDDGWFELEWQLCENLEKLVPKDYKLMQVKEKYGTLRWYDCGGTDAVNGQVRLAEKASAETCEVCGKKAQLCSTGGWLKTLCEGCLELPEFRGRYFKSKEGF